MCQFTANDNAYVVMQTQMAEAIRIQDRLSHNELNTCLTKHKSRIARGACPLTHVERLQLLLNVILVHLQYIDAAPAQLQHDALGLHKLDQLWTHTRRSVNRRRTGPSAVGSSRTKSRRTPNVMT